jgi:NitT/TauT family transport system permease protein
MLVVVLWHATVKILGIPRYLVPSPLEVLTAIRDNALTLVKAAGLTAAASLAGFAASLTLGTLTAFAFSQWNAIRRGLYPYAIFLQTVPIVAVAPLIVIWFGTGITSVVIVSFIISVFPVITNATAGLMRLDPDFSDLFRLNVATRAQTLFKLKLPNAVPSIVTGAKIASGLSVIGAIVGEFFAGYGSTTYGLGYLIVFTSGQLNTPLLFAAIFASTTLGIAIFGLVTWIGDTLLARWQEM